MIFSRLAVRPVVLGTLILVLADILPVGAAARKTKPPPPVDTRILVTAVNAADHQITIVFKRTGQVESYTIDDFTQVTFQNSTGSFKDIKVGQELFSYVERDAHTLDSLTVGAAESPSHEQGQMTRVVHGPAFLALR